MDKSAKKQGHIKEALFPKSTHTHISLFLSRGEEKTNSGNKVEIIQFQSTFCQSCPCKINLIQFSRTQV